MSVDRLLNRYAKTQDPDPDGAEDFGAYGLLRGIRTRASMIEFRKKDGAVLALPYPAIEQMLYTPDDGIRIRAGGRDIHVSGRHLNDTGGERTGLFVALARHLVLWVQESPRAVSINTAATSVVVESIIW